MKLILKICILCALFALSGCGVYKVDICIFKASSGEPIIGGKILIFKEGGVPSVDSYWESHVAEIDESMNTIYENDCSIMTSFINDIQSSHTEKLKSLQESDPTINLERCA